MPIFNEKTDEILEERLIAITKKLDEIRDHMMDAYNPFGSECTPVQKEAVLQIHQTIQATAGMLEMLVNRLRAYK